jgi:hypothetical protein
MRTILFTLMSLCFLIAASIAFAQSPNVYNKDTPMGPMTCMPYSEFKEIAVKQYGEVKRGWGMMADMSGIVELHYNEKTGTWVIVLAVPEKDHISACLGPHGENWEAVDAPPTGKKS